MSRPGITYFDVAKAATQLREQNQRPSIEAIRLLLGTGSNSTINQHLRQWRQHHGNKMECEQGIPESLLIAVKGTYDAICAQANTQLEKITQENKQVIDSLQLKAADLEKNYNQLTQQKMKLQSLFDQVQDEKSAIESINQQLNKTIYEKNTENNALNDKLIDREKQIDRLTLQINHFQASLDHYRESIREERIAEKHAFESNRDELKNQLQTQSHRTRQVEEKTIQLQQKLEDLMAEKQTIASKHDQLIEQYQATKADLQKMNWQHDNLKQQLHSTQSECQTLTQTTTQDKSFIAEVNITLAKQQQQIEQYKNMLNISEEKIANLVHKNLFLTQEKTELAAQIKFGQHSD